MIVAIAGGAGGVGSSLAFNLLVRPEPFDVVVIDRRPQKVLSHVLDLEQLLALGSGARPGRRRGVLEWDLSPTERAGLARAAAKIAAAVPG